MIDNVILLLKGTLNGRDVNELIPQVNFVTVAIVWEDQMTQSFVAASAGHV